MEEHGTIRELFLQQQRGILTVLNATFIIHIDLGIQEIRGRIDNVSVLFFKGEV